MWQIIGWVAIVAGALIAGPAAAKLIARRKNSRMAASSARSRQWAVVFSGLMYVSAGLLLVTYALWVRAAFIIVAVASGLFWLTFGVRERRQKS